MAADDRVSLMLDEYNTVTVHKFGATVISWKCSGYEMLFTSKQAVFDHTKPIRGGIPICWPNVGPWAAGPQHGFARISLWNLDSMEKNESSIKAVFSLTNNSQSEAMWNHKFKLVYTVTLSYIDGLSCRLDVFNSDETEFDFTALLHNYLLVNDIDKVTIFDLNGTSYIDKLDNSATKQENEECVTFSGAIDRVYKSTQSSHDLYDSSTGRRVSVMKENLPDTGIWNPWAEWAKKTVDFGDEEYKRMVCIEPGAIAERIPIRPGEMKSFSQTIRAVALGFASCTAQP